MKKLKNELKMYLAEKLLGWAMSLAPFHQTEGFILWNHIRVYFEYKVKNKIQ